VGQYPKTGHDRFLPRPFQLIIRNYSITERCTAYAIVKASLKAQAKVPSRNSPGNTEENNENLLTIGTQSGIRTGYSKTKVWSGTVNWHVCKKHGTLIVKGLCRNVWARTGP